MVSIGTFETHANIHTENNSQKNKSKEELTSRIQNKDIAPLVQLESGPRRKRRVAPITVIVPKVRRPAAIRLTHRGLTENLLSKKKGTRHQESKHKKTLIHQLHRSNHRPHTSSVDTGTLPEHKAGPRSNTEAGRTSGSFASTDRARSQSPARPESTGRPSAAAACRSG